MQYENYIHLQQTLTALMHFMQRCEEAEAVNALLECKTAIVRIDKAHGDKVNAEQATRREAWQGSV